MFLARIKLSFLRYAFHELHLTENRNLDASILDTIGKLNEAVRVRLTG